MPDSVMKAIDPGDLSPAAAYALMIAAIVPRPIALVSTLSESGVRNIAPFSYFSGVSSRPPLLVISIAKGRDGEKDTMRNIRATREFVVNIVDRRLAAACAMTSGEFPPETDEFDVAGLTAMPSDKVSAPRILQSPVHMECVPVEIVEQPGGAEVSLVIGRVLRFHVARRVWRQDTIDPQALDPLARLGGDLYAGLGEAFPLLRPGK